MKLYMVHVQLSDDIEVEAETEAGAMEEAITIARRGWCTFEEAYVRSTQDLQEVENEA